MAAEDQELIDKKKKVAQKMDELASTTSALNDALLKYAEQTAEATKAIKDAEGELKDQEMMSRRVKSSLGIWSNTLYGIIAAGRQDIEVSKKKTAIKQSEVNQAEAALKAAQDTLQVRIREKEESKSLIRLHQEQRSVVKQQMEAARSSVVQTRQSIAQATSQKAAAAAAAKTHETFLFQESKAIEQSILSRYNEIAAAEKEGSINPEAAAAKRAELDSELDKLKDKIQESRSGLQAENLRRSQLSTEIEQLQEQIQTDEGVLKELSKKYEEQTSAISMHMQAAGDAAASETKLKQEIDQLSDAVNDRKNKLAAAKEEELGTKLGILQKASASAAQTLQKVANELGKLVDVVRQTQQKFGLSAGTAAKLEFGILQQSIKSYAQSLMTAGKVIPVSREEIKAATEAYQQEFGGVLTPEAATDIAQQAKRMGVTASALAGARRQFLTQTMGDAGKAKAVEEKFIGEFKKKGLTSKEAFESLQKYSEIYARNGNRFATSFTRAAAEAKKIGVDLGKIDQVGDNIIGDFEGFLTKMSELGAMGFNFDTSRLAEIAESGDTGALMEELRSQLAAQGKDLNNLRRSEQLAISQAFGINVSELQRMAAPKKADTESASGEKILPPADLDKDSNSKLGDMVNLLDGIKGLLSVISIAVGAIAAKSTIGVLKNIMSGGGGRIGGAVRAVGGGIRRAGGAVTRTIGSIVRAPARLLDGGGLMSRTAGVASRATGGLAQGARGIMSAARGSSVLGGLGGAAKFGGRLLGKAALPLAVGMSAFDAFKGFTADKDATLGEKFKNAGSSMLSGLTFGLLGKDASEIKETASTRTTIPTTPASVTPATMAAATATKTITPTTEPQPVKVDFASLEKKLDGLVAAIGRMSVQIDGTKVGRVVATNAASTSQVGVFARSS